ncbi:TolB family protein [Rheinheimera sp. 4Y26]|uniref:TolB family protein n=1 Tax=Rheinheimera sp. 4Y26 TaxID=2977811 RepID=UPI0021B098BF|nr:hypothetical protein [Rheinheimera sp. 4Y26]MCT6698517.1 hypothetical protein [Rheinheimera sp. 4Y26]
MAVLKKLLFISTFSAASLVQAQTTSADFRLYLAELKPQSISNIKAVPTAGGYQNQPAFSADGRFLYWTSEQKNADTSQMDIASLELSSGKTGLYRATALSEFSPTALPDGALSAVVVEADGTQRLWRIPAQGEAKALFLEPSGVGYHAWGPAGDLLLFILGKDEADHQIAYRSSQGELTTLAKNIGRALAWRPGSKEGYFTEKQGDQLALSWFDAGSKTLKSKQLLLPETGQDLRWFNTNTLLVSAGSNIYSWQPGANSWQVWLDLSKSCNGSVSRFSISPNQQQLAFVCQPKVESAT